MVSFPTSNFKLSLDILWINECYLQLIPNF